MYQNKQNFVVPEKKVCYFCQNNMEKIDYKEAYFLRRFLNSQARIYSPKRFGTCAKHQRILANAIKKARVMGLLPFTIK